MDKFERVFELHTLLSQRRGPVPRLDLEKKFECSRSTLNRLLAFYRDALGAPLEYDRERCGYYLNLEPGEHFELPGLWFNASELLALMTSHRLLAEVQPGVLEPYLAPLRQRLESLLKDKLAGSEAIFERIRILPMAQRTSNLEDFQKITDALVSRHQLRIQYNSRGEDKLTERWVSPQRLIYYRDNWYMDGWCHLREGIRTFSLDRLNVAEKGGAAINIEDAELNQHFTRTYGIFAGSVAGTAVIHFTDKAAKWVADEDWHPEQTSKRLDNGKWEITVPYGDPTELIRDILKYGSDAEVVAPASLRQQVKAQLTQALKNYKK